MVRAAADQYVPDFRRFRAVCPGWDNEPRRPGRGFVVANSTPALYAAWLAAACREAMGASDPDERIVFINAWNEWAEGAMLEPDRHFGHAYLLATARVLTALERGSTPARRLAIISHDAHRHGAQLLALRLARTFVERMGIATHLLLGGGGALAGDFIATAPTERVGGFDDAAAWQAAARRLRHAGIGTVLCNTLVSAQAIPHLCAAGLRAIVLVHELPGIISEYGLLDAALLAAREAEALVFPATIVRERFQELVGPISARAVIRPQGVWHDTAQQDSRPSTRAAMRARLAVPDRHALVLGAGFGDRRKGLDLWPDIIRATLDRHLETTFVWAGAVDPRVRTQIEAKAARLGIAGRLRLPGSFESMHALYTAADLFVLSSREDPFPSVVLEAMAHRLPVTAFDGSGGIVDLVRRAGRITVPLGDAIALGRAIAVLLGDRAASAAIGAAGERIVGSEFDFGRYAEDIADLAFAPARLAVAE
jgi:glycosyltransferase involved in cell wall biosynthesis